MNEYSSVRPFTHYQAIAAAVHEVNRAYQIAIGEAPSPHWDGASEEMKTSTMKGIGAALLGSSPEQLHELWCETRKATGWTLGPVKDEAKKEHPCLVPYAELPRDQRVKDALFASVVRAMAIALDIEHAPEQVR